MNMQWTTTVPLLWAKLAKCCWLGMQCQLVSQGQTPEAASHAKPNYCFASSVWTRSTIKPTRLVHFKVAFGSLLSRGNTKKEKFPFVEAGGSAEVANILTNWLFARNDSNLHFASNSCYKIPMGFSLYPCCLSVVKKSPPLLGKLTRCSIELTTQNKGHVL